MLQATVVAVGDGGRDQVPFNLDYLFNSFSLVIRKFIIGNPLLRVCYYFNTDVTLNRWVKRC